MSAASCKGFESMLSLNFESGISQVLIDVIRGKSSADKAQIQVHSIGNCLYRSDVFCQELGETLAQDMKRARTCDEF
jgi:hypothetical protein